MNKLLKLFDSTTNVMASKNAGKGMLRGKKKKSSYLTTESIALKEKPPKHDRDRTVGS